MVSRKTLVLVFAFLTGVTAVRMALIRHLPLTGDEAYYWEWSRHLALGYHDHPPLVGWLIALSAHLGESAFWVRFPSLLLSVLTGIFLFFFTYDLWKSESLAFFALLLYSVLPIFFISSIGIFPDVPLLFNWMLFLWAFRKWLEEEKLWPCLGTALGLAMLSKLMGFFLFPSLVLTLFFAKSHLPSRKPLWKRASLWKSLVLAFLLTSPLFYWNFHHHFETFTYQIHQRVMRGMAFSPGFFLNYLSLQFVSLSPLVVFLIFGTVLFLVARAGKGDFRAFYLLSAAAPIHIFFLLVSFFTRVGLHWALPGTLALLPAAPAFAEELFDHGKRWGWKFFWVSSGIAFLVTLFVFSSLQWPELLIPRIISRGLRMRNVNQGKTLTSPTVAEILSYPELGKRIDFLLRKMTRENPGRKIFVVTDSYSLSSVISFYAKTDGKTILFTSTGGEYSRWNHFRDFAGDDALYVDVQPAGSRPDIARILRKAFRSTIPLEPFFVTSGTIPAGRFYFIHCKQLLHPEALSPKWQ